MKTGWIEQRPEPARLWIRWRPRAWPLPRWPWTDVAAGELGEKDGPAEQAPALGIVAPSAAVDDVVWLPPVPPSGSPGRLALAARLAGAGVPVVLQVLVTGGSAEGEPARSTPSPRHAAGEPATDPGPVPSAGSGEAAETLLPTRPSASGDPTSGAEGPHELAPLASSGVVVLLDPLPVLLADGPSAAVAATAEMACAISGAAVVWPLIPGFGPGDETARAAAGALAAAGASALQPLVLRLTAAQRRRLAERRGEEIFDALFHHPPPDERRFARAAAAAGRASFPASSPAPLLPRPLPRPPLAGAETRRLAGLLALAGELWVRCGRAPAAGQALFRAARWADDAGYDLGALAREGNLGVIAALDERSRALIAEAASGGTPALVRELLDEYTAPEDAGARETEETAVATLSEEVGNG